MGTRWVQGFNVDPTNPEHMEKLLANLQGQPCVLCGDVDAPHIYEFTPTKEEKHDFAPGDMPPSLVGTIHTPLCSDCLQQAEVAPTAIVPEMKKRIKDEAARSRGEKV